MICLEVSAVSFLENGPYSFSLETGECLGLSGDSGVGKTQLLRALCDLIPYRGEVRLFGRASVEMAAPEWRRRITMVPADSAWWHDEVGPHFIRGQESALFDHALQVLGFNRDVMKWRISRLSTGERQRLALIRALVQEPQVLLLDEPTSGLDAYHAAKLELLVAEMRAEKDTAVIWVSHDPEQLQRVAGRILRVERQALIAERSGAL